MPITEAITNVRMLNFTIFIYFGCKKITGRKMDNNDNVHNL